MFSITFVVNNQPPWKQSPASPEERKRQTDRSQALQEKAKEVFKSAPTTVQCCVSIHYSRNQGQMDSGNIIGGVLDSLEGIIYNNDKQAIQISYIEWHGENDSYQITITELAV